MAKLKDETRRPHQPGRTRAETRALEQLYSIRHIVDELTKPGALSRLFDQGRFTNAPDGWPTRAGSDGTPHGEAELTRVEAAANARSCPRDDDPTGEAIADIVTGIARMAAEARSIDGRLGYINHVHHAAAGRQQTSTGGPCQCCSRDVPGTEYDRLRGGYCDACRKAWERAGRPDRHQFEAERRQRTGDTQTSTSTGVLDDTSPDEVLLDVSVTDVRP